MTVARPLLLLCLTALLGCDIATGLSELTFDLPGAGGGGGSTDPCAVLATHHWSGSGDHRPRDVVVDADGVVVVGEFTTDMDVGGTTLTSGVVDGFAVRLDDAGVVTARALGSSTAANLSAVARVGDGWMVTGGDDGVGCDAGGPTIFVARMDASLSLGSCAALPAPDAGFAGIDDVAATGTQAFAAGLATGDTSLDGVAIPAGAFLLRLDAAELTYDGHVTDATAAGPGDGRMAIATRPSGPPFATLRGESDGVFGSALPTPPAAADASAYLVASNANGTSETIARVGGDGLQFPEDVAAFGSDTAILVGGYEAGIDFSGDDDALEIPVPDAVTAGGGFVASYQQDGELAWRTFFDSPTSDDEVSSVVVAGDGSIFVTGELGLYHDHPTVECEPLADPTEQLFVARLDPDGTVRWVRHFSATGGRSQGRALALSPDESELWIVAELEGSLTIGSETFESTGRDVLVVAMPSTL